MSEVKEMERRFDLRKVFFIDNGFNVPIDHAKTLCHALIDADLSLHWNTCMAPFSCDAELVGLMKQAGCALVIMGNTRGDPHDGASLNDRLEPLLEVCRLCEEGGLHYTISQTFGEPGETRESVEEKLAFLRQLVALVDQVLLRPRELRLQVLRQRHERLVLLRHRLWIDT